jgi:hypothetical protein
VFESDNAAHFSDDSDVDDDVQGPDNEATEPEHVVRNEPDDIFSQMRSFEERLCASGKNLSPDVITTILERHRRKLTGQLEVRRVIPNYPQLEQYDAPETDVRTFNQEFPLGNIFKKWKDGIRLFAKTKSSFLKGRPAQNQPLLNEAITRLQAAGILTESKRGPFCTYMFFVPKSDNKVRPVVDYSKTSKSINTPRMVLPSLFQFIQRKSWPKKLWYCKIDFRHAFFNIPLHPKSKFITCFKNQDKYYAFNFLPFGISVAPYIMQKFLNAICSWIRDRGVHAWGHIDDILIACQDRQLLKTTMAELLVKLGRAKWKINKEKSVTKQDRRLLGLEVFSK